MLVTRNIIMVKKLLKDDLDFEIQFFEGVLQKKPDFFEALSALGDVYTKKGLYDKGLEIDKKLVQIRPGNPIVLYNLACSYSLLNKISLSFLYIKKAIESGYSHMKYLEHDSDLDNLRKDVRFVKYLEKVKKQNKVER